MNEELAKRAVACKHWRWLAGMAYTCRGYTYRVDPEILNAGGKYGDACMPDLTDPATLGCLLALYEETRMTKVVPDPVYTWIAAYGLISDQAISALVSALESAP